MGYLDFLLHTPYSWVTLSGLFVGAAVSRLTTPVRHRKDPDRARSVKLAGVNLAFTFAVIAATLAVFVPDAERINDIGLVYQFTGAVVVGGLAIRFKLSVGMPVFLVVLAAALTTFAVRQVWTAYEADRPVAGVRVLGSRDDRSTVEFVAGAALSNRPQDAQIVTISGDRFSVTASRIELSPHYFFVGMSQGVRIVSVRGEAAPGLELPGPPAPGRFIAELARRTDGSIPGVDLSEVQTPPIRGVVLREYSVSFTAEGELETREAR